MNQITVTINDYLEETENHLIELVKDYYIDYIKAEECSHAPDMSDIDHDGSITDMIDAQAQFGPSQVKDIMYLYGDKIEKAFDDCGYGGSVSQNGYLTAICCYLNDVVATWFYNESEEFFDSLEKPWLDESEEE